MEIKARAKINWTLDILGQREDGYHFMDMLMQPLTLCDELVFFPADGLRLTVEGALLSDGEDNLILKAARLLQNESGIRRGAEILLRKHIPMGAGLGGGSADAAAALKALNDLWGLGYSLSTLCALGEKLGADVPFCVMDRPMRALGIGEILTSISVRRCYPLVLVQPCGALSTGEIFRGYHGLPPRHPDTEKCRAALEKGDLSILRQSGGNVLEQVSVAKQPKIATAKEKLYELGAAFAQMTGSGSVVFGAFEDRAAAEKAYALLKPEYPDCILTETGF